MSALSPTADLMKWMLHDARTRRFLESRKFSARLARRFVAGESMSSALDAAGELLARGRFVSLSYLAAEPLDRAEARERLERLRKLLRRLGQAGYAQDGRADLSLRLSTLGAHLGRDGMSLATAMAGDIVTGATQVGTRVTVEAEPGLKQGAVLDAVAALSRDCCADVAIALPAAAPRTERDCAVAVLAGQRVRLGRGAPRSPGALAAAGDVDRAYVRCLQILVAHGRSPGIATHDPRIAHIAQELMRRHDRGPGEVEFQLPYGVRSRRQTTVADRGGLMRVYLPYGPDWYPYLVDRVAERPAEVPGLLGAFSGANA